MEGWLKARANRSAGTMYSAPEFEPPASMRRTEGFWAVRERREARTEPEGPAERRIRGM